MNIFGIGVDIVDLDRIKKIYSKYGDKFAYKILNENEIKGFNSVKNKSSFLAKRFAAKEAIGKALGIGILNGFLLKNISIYHDELGKPMARLSSRKDFDLYLDKEIHISISDEKKFAVANALILSK
ncbi:MAG: holo-ACP synthase [Gammaproteobacteria bacterium]|jgi:holo-[acyl-carrier protein] synthase|nr:holo-ACP synthase [Gammaproteobacteria bacterium]|tara:strand:+ start:5654 stop:6031 length:378 start_codon:yes stop_codon:yes gene_type:complete